jgi:DNA-binding response OmpR family regulator
MKKKIVLVEDDPDILFTVNFILENAGYTVCAIATAQSLLENNYDLPDLFILDKRMPDMDGIDVCRHLRTLDNSKEIPIIIISASPRFGPQALKAGANDFLEKPFQMKDLLKLVAKYLPE